MTVPNSGYVICGDGLVGSIDGGGTVAVNSSSIVGTDFNFDLTVTMPSGTYDGSRINEMRLYLCDSRGDVVCFYFPLRLYCEEIDIDPRSRIADAFKISPNPSFDQFTLEMPKSFGQNEKLSVELLSTSGKSVFRTTTKEQILTVDTKKLDAGIYYIVVSKDSEMLYQEKVILIK